MSAARPDARCLELLYEATPLRVWRFDADARLTHANPAVLALLGQDLQSVRGKTLVEIVDLEFGAELHDILQTRLAEGRDVDALPVRFQVKGIEHCSFADIRVLRDGQGDVEGALVLSRETTEVHALSARYVWHEELLAMAFDHALMGIVVTDLEDVVRAANQTAGQMLGFPRSELKGLVFEELILGNPPCVETGPVPMQLKAADGSAVDVRFHHTVVREPNGQPLLRLIQFEDVREQLELRSQIQQQNEYLAHVDRLSALGEMAASIAHEVNQPLTAINNYVRATIRRLDDPDPPTEIMTSSLIKAAEQAERAADIIQRIRQFSRRHASERRCLQINDVIGELNKLLSSDAQRQGAMVSTQLSPDLPSVCGDPVQLTQVVMNLVRNAIDAVHDCDADDRRIEIRTELGPDACVRVVVADWGSGVDESDRPSLFEPFFTTKREGVGIGLSISKSIIEAHGGQIQYTPNEPSGSVFCFGLPPA